MKLNVLHYYDDRHLHLMIIVTTVIIIIILVMIRLNTFSPNQGYFSHWILQSLTLTGKTCSKRQLYLHLQVHWIFVRSHIGLHNSWNCSIIISNFNIYMLK